MHMSCGGSDVCSSNLWAIVGESGSGKSVLAQSVLGILPASGRITAGRILLDAAGLPGGPVDLAALGPASKAYQTIRGGRVSIIFQEPMTRSDEHTSELQSLMRISYAVFCLKKNTLHTVITASSITILVYLS